MGKKKQKDEKGVVLLKRGEIKNRVEQLAQQIVKDYGRKNIVLVILMKGACWFGVDMSRAIERRRQGKGKLFEEFLCVSSYGDERESSGVVKIDTDIQRSIKGKHTLIIDDVADTGLTLSGIKRYLETKKPRSLKICVLIEKNCPTRVCQVKLDYVGFRGVEGFLVGYGLDDGGTKRGLEYIKAI